MDSMDWCYSQITSRVGCIPFPKLSSSMCSSVAGMGRSSEICTGGTRYEGRDSGHAGVLMRRNYCAFGWAELVNEVLLSDFNCSMDTPILPMWRSVTQPFTSVPILEIE